MFSVGSSALFTSYRLLTGRCFMPGLAIYSATGAAMCKIQRDNTMNMIYLIRHGENPANLTKEFSFKKVDYGLTERGHLQAEQTAEFFKNIKINALYSSPLKRAIQTAEYISKSYTLNSEVIEEFREINVGDLELMKPDKKSWVIYFKVTGEWYNGNKRCSFPHGENYQDLLYRFYNGLRLATENNTDQNIIIVGHGGIFTAGVFDLCEIKDKESFLNQDNHNCSISIIKLMNKENKLKAELLQWAKHDHLYGEAL